MNYLKAFFFNFFIVFFVNYILPGISVVSQTKIPNIGSDLIFAVALGVVNTLIYPVLKMCHHATLLKIAGLSLVVSFVAYALLKFLHLGIHVTTFTGYASAALLVAIGSFLINYFEMRYHYPKAHVETPPSTEYVQPK